MLLRGRRISGTMNGLKIIFWIMIVWNCFLPCIVVYILVFFSSDAEFDFRNDTNIRIKTQLLQFLTPLYEDCEYFVHDQRTFGNESFHSICNRYYEKGSVVSFKIFVMKRQFAALDWNEMMRKKALGEEDTDIQDWQELLLSRLMAALKA